MSSSSLIAQAQDLIEATTTKVAYVTPTNIEQVKIDLKGVLDTAVCRGGIIMTVFNSSWTFFRSSRTAHLTLYPSKALQKVRFG